MKIPSLLTDSEWRVMRVLWEKPTCTAAAVTAALAVETAWSPTTVKTFLSRLAAKRLVSYQADGGRYLYSANASERDCVIAEMKAVLNRVYGGTVRGETEHFRFYGVDDEKLVSRLSAKLEATFLRMERDYRCREDGKQTVYLYPSLSRMHSALGLQVGPEWLRAGMEWDILHLGPEALFTDMTIEQAAAHVWIQMVVRRMNPAVPHWLEQGIAAYEGGWIQAPRFDRAIDAVKGTVAASSIASLPTQFDLFRAAHGYELAWTAVDFIVRTYGLPALVSFVENPQAYEAAFKESESAFWRRWTEDFRARYRPNERGYRP